MWRTQPAYLGLKKSILNMLLRLASLQDLQALLLCVFEAP